MAQQKSRLAAARSLSTVLDQLGVQRLEALRRADLTDEGRERAGITPDEEFQLVAAGELHSFGLPLEVAKALAFGRAVGSASEMATLAPEEVAQVLEEPPVKELLPKEFVVSLEVIESWLRQIPPLAADEQSSARGAVSEETDESVANDADTAFRAEDGSLSREVVTELIAALRERSRRGESALEALARGAHAKPDVSEVRDAVLGLQADLGDIVDRFAAAETGGFIAVDEERESALADDALEPERDIHLLEEELARIEGTLDALRMATESGDEDRAPAAASEDAHDDLEAQARGE